MEIYQHFRKDEQGFIDQVLAWKEHVEKTYQPKLTDFLDPREQQIVEMLIGSQRDVLALHKSGGTAHTERKRIIIAPIYDEIEEQDFALTLMQAAYQDKFISLTHRDVMGAFLSLGVKRKKLGDIHVASGIVQIIMSSDIAAYIKANLTAIKKAKIALEERPVVNFLGEEKYWAEADHTVSSLRLDAILKEIYKLSRKDATNAITKSLVKVNYKTVENPAYQLQEGDILSFRGKGRSKLAGINGKTKKEKWKITTAILK
ncbi:RNA-binding protein [Virgibacillus dakarensis]|nr:RNA-binding protein [Virgibacillus dakarensis]